MPSEPPVSVIMPAYNAERYIAEAVESVLAQSWQNWELIVVNDGSTDGTGAYLGGLEDHRVRVIHQENGGVSEARNTGIDAAKGEYLTFLDADDALPVHSLKSRVVLLDNNPDIDVAHGIVSIQDEQLSEEMKTYRPFYYSDLLQKALRLDSRMLFNPCYMIRQSEIGHSHFKSGMTHCEDILFFIHLLTRKLVPAFVDEAVYYYRMSGSSAMSNMQGLLRGYIELVENVMLIPEVRYFDTLIMRLKIMRVLVSWNLRNKNIVGLLDVFRLFSIGVKAGF